MPSKCELDQNDDSTLYLTFLTLFPAQKIPKPNSKYQDYLSNPNEHSIFLAEVVPHEIDEIIKSMGSNKSCDLYGITSNVIKLRDPVQTKIPTLIF